MRRVLTSVLAFATAAPLVVLLSTGPAIARDRCVDRSEWSRMEHDLLGSRHRSARREVVEARWRVSPVGRKDLYWLTGDRFYSYAYPYCGSSALVVVIYRDSSDAWQYALKGRFVTQPAPTVRVAARRFA